MAVTFEADQVMKALNDQFQDTIQVAANMLIKYDLDHLALLADASFEQRRAPIIAISTVLQNRQNALDEATYYLGLAQDLLADCYIEEQDGTRLDSETGESRPKYKSVCIDKQNAEKWTNLIDGAQLWLTKNKTVQKAAKSQLALFRNISILDAFKGYEKDRRGSVFGGSTGGLAAVKRTLSSVRDKALGKKKLSADDEKFLKDRGVDPNAPIPESVVKP